MSNEDRKVRPQEPLNFNAFEDAANQAFAVQAKELKRITDAQFAVPKEVLEARRQRATATESIASMQEALARHEHKYSRLVSTSPEIVRLVRDDGVGRSYEESLKLTQLLACECGATLRYVTMTPIDDKLSLGTIPRTEQAQEIKAPTVDLGGPRRLKIGE